MSETRPDNPPRIVTCPTCQRRVKWTLSNPDRPFCSERCRDVDLSRWLRGDYAIPGGQAEADEDGQDAAARRASADRASEDDETAE